jgi:parallel beta-helix repeat protein
MKRKLVLIMSLTLLIGMLNVAFNVQKAKAAGTIYIRADGSIDPPDVRITTFDNVTYTFTTNIDDSIVVERDNIVVDGAGYTVQGTGSGTGLSLSGRSNVTIKSMTITAFDWGIYLNSSSNSTLSGNNITANNWYGIELYSSSNCSVSGNNITANNWYGIELYSSSNCSVSGNNITANNWSGIWLLYSSNNSVSGNNITANNGYGIELYSSSNCSVSGNNITDNNYFGIYLADSSGNGVSGNTFTNDGLFVYDSYQNSVENNTVNGRPLAYLEGVSNYTVADAGQVVLVRCENIRVEGLNLSRTTVGVELWETINSTISGNNITANNGYGVLLLSSSNYNSVSGNNITANSWSGIYLETADSNSISGNNITANNGEGIRLYSSSNYNSVSGNNITDNDYGIELSSSSNNKIFHNNFVNNNIQAYSSPASANVWDDGYPSGGNYWSNYAGVDLHSGSDQTETGSDGIGDAPHVIDEDNTDRYPLMAPYSTFDAGTWNETPYDVDVVSNSTVSDFHFNPEEGPLLEFNVTGQEGTVGFCRVAIPKDLLWVEDGWTVYVGEESVDCTIVPDNDYTYLYFTYDHSTKTVHVQGTSVIPEFPLFLILPLFMIATLLVVIACRRRKVRCGIPSIGSGKQNFFSSTINIEAEVMP